MYICVTLLSLEAVVVLGATVKKALPKVLKCFNSFTQERENSELDKANYNENGKK